MSFKASLKFSFSTSISRRRVRASTLLLHAYREARISPRSFRIRPKMSRRAAIPHSMLRRKLM
jgi:hypothetical protein